MQTMTSPEVLAQPAQDFLPLKGTDYVEFYVGNAKQSAYYYQAAFGFELVAYAGPETGLRDRASYVLQQGKIRLVLTTSLLPDSDITRARGPARRRREGDGPVGGRCPPVVGRNHQARRPVGLRALYH